MAGDREMSVEQMVRNILEQAEKDGLIRCEKPPQEMTSGDLVGCANLLSAYVDASAVLDVRYAEPPPAWLSIDNGDIRIVSTYARCRRFRNRFI